MPCRGRRLHEIRRRQLQSGVVLVQGLARFARFFRLGSEGVECRGVLRMAAGRADGCDPFRGHRAQPLCPGSQGDVACGLGRAPARRIPCRNRSAAQGLAHPPLRRHADGGSACRDALCGMGGPAGTRHLGRRFRRYAGLSRGRGGRGREAEYPGAGNRHFDLRCDGGVLRGDRGPLPARHLRPGGWQRLAGNGRPGSGPEQFRGRVCDVAAGAGMALAPVLRPGRRCLGEGLQAHPACVG